jgi:hypothetical protein
MLDKPGDYQLLVMDEAGQVATVNFTLQYLKTAFRCELLLKLVLF